MEKPITEAELVNENPQALAVRPPGGEVGKALPADEIKPKATAQELRVVEVSEALLPAYQKASTLALTDDEIAGLMAPFPDEAVEIRPHDGLIYLPHINVSNRLNKILKPGQWSLVCRRHWLEGTTMYGEYVLLIRGCYVGESVGGHPYQPNNPKVNYSDTLESTAAEALRRICGKRLSCGSQCWIPEYARNWVDKYAVYSGGKWSKRSNAAPATTAAPPPSPRPAPAPAQPMPEPAAKIATPEYRAKMIANLKAGPGQENRETVTEYFRKVGPRTPLAPFEELEDLPLWAVPINKEQMHALASRIGDFNAGERAEEAFPPNAEPEPAKAAPAAKKPAAPAATPAGSVSSNGEPWRDVIVPIPHKGQKRDDYLKNPDTIGSLYDLRHGSDDEAQEARRRLWGFVTNYEPKGWTGKDGQARPASASDIAFRASLDQFAEWFEQNHPGEKL